MGALQAQFENALGEADACLLKQILDIARRQAEFLCDALRGDAGTGEIVRDLGQDCLQPGCPQARGPASSAASPFAPVTSPIRSTIVSVACDMRSGETRGRPVSSNWQYRLRRSRASLSAPIFNASLSSICGKVCMRAARGTTTVVHTFQSAPAIFSASDFSASDAVTRTASPGPTPYSRPACAPLNTVSVLLISRRYPSSLLSIAVTGDVARLPRRVPDRPGHLLKNQ